MTAEVAILNRNGLALAADSAVTIGPAANKIYTSAEKLFQLSRSGPIGIMIYGNAVFCGLPWETIIKTYRRRHGGDSFDTVSACGERFIEFLGNASDLFPTTWQIHHVERLVYSLMLHVRSELRDRFNEEAEERDGLNDEDLPPIIDEVTEGTLAAIRKNELLQQFNDSDRQEVASLVHDRMKEMREEVFGNLPFSQTALQALTELVQEMLVRHCFGPMECGVVIGGFGNKEYMPSLVNFAIEEMVVDKPRAVRTQECSIDNRSSAAVMPFAQKDMVESFMEGIHQELHRHMKHTTHEMFKGAIERLVKAVADLDHGFADALESVAETAGDEMLQKLFAEWQDRQEGYWGPVVNIVDALPKDELAAMAEALVNLTKFRRRVSASRETVGGPIDVAVITKGDGFVWTQRKHYFDSDLNPRVMARLQSEV